MRSILDIAATLDLPRDTLMCFGEHMAKIRPHIPPSPENKPQGKIILVSAINPTRSGEGKTTVAIGLAQGLARIGKQTALALREPSLGPIFGVKGGGTGGGRCQLEPSSRINMHFTGDMHAVSAAHNLLAALLDNAIHFRSELDLEHRQIFWRRVLDVNDRALRQTIIGLGGRLNGVPREAGFDITAASEIMAILCLCENIADLKARIGHILVGFDRSGHPVTAQRLKATGALAALLQDAMLPNLVQSTEGVPAFVHGGPFGNIAHGCNSVIATKTAASYAEFVITEAGFGFDLGAEKFFDLKCRSSGLWPSAVVLVVTIRALKIHGGDNPEHTSNHNTIERGLEHLGHHVNCVRVFGFEPVIAINCFQNDSTDDLAIIENWCAQRKLIAARFTGFTHGGAGAETLAHAILNVTTQSTPKARYLYPLDAAPEEKIATIARTIYGACDIEFSRNAQKDLEKIRAFNYEHLPICIAKTHLSLSDDPTRIGHPQNFVLPVESIRIAAGAGYLLALTGDIVTMPGLPHDPAAHRIDLTDDNNIIGI